ncbi:bifunctional transcriptional activator/DNA repair enzyme AdaA [Pseudoalteromonas spongiae]|uniref:bifunctional transcriptional activator/DNA repair enzyme AdaA n=1 Tax=Pseudoalteromonas spongiae TaxID=298657 RepID=UPI00026CA9A0|nr:bifunctional transcriptional activator/DNA repair protein Ada [Pseudoalteromonas spongiae]ATC97974.1 AraC family transcriptional regulator, regulatory protein of adaptative response / methylated-DNA-[protein]-cysteine methyltransferase [Pseudoalteromonas spongiae UST010723-006]
MKITQPEKINEYYQALVDKNSQYLGCFYACVTSTQIFCIATCSARKPKKENVEFCSEVKDALDAGFRPCKVCKPTQNAHSMPEPVATALKLLAQKGQEKLSDYHLKEAGIQPELVRRWFKKHYGMTFQAYQRMVRINTAYQEIQNGKQLIDSALDSGFNSLSGFAYTFKKATGLNPSKSKEKQVILIARHTTPIGPMFICATNNGVCLVEFVDRRMLETEFNDLQKRLNAVILQGENEHIKQCRAELSEYFAGKRKEFSIPLDLAGTEFQQGVWQGLQTIPFGETRSYSEQATALNNAKAVRAVATANGMNRVAIIVPCHRVIGKDGSLTGYGGGLERKAWLLRHEAADFKE